MKKILAMLLTLVMLFGLVACGGSAQRETAEEPASEISFEGLEELFKED